MKWFEALGAELVDGIFGSVTRQCVIELQRKNGLDVDGIVGYQTWRALVKR